MIFYKGAEKYINDPHWRNRIHDYLSLCSILFEQQQQNNDEYMNCLNDHGVDAEITVQARLKARAFDKIVRATLDEAYAKIGSYPK